MAIFRLAPALALLAVSAPAWAESPSPSFGWKAGSADLPASLRLPVSTVRSSGSTEAPPVAAKKKKKNVLCNQNGCGYKALLGGLVITRDLQATQDVSLRVLPTSHALGGDDAPTKILLRAEVDDDGYYGVRLRAKF